MTTLAKPYALIAEDSRIQAKILENRLIQGGYEVAVAGDGGKALELARQRKPDIIISDIEMPRVTGYEFCRAVKQDPQLRHVPVILLSTLAEPEDIIRGLDAGADNYVTKPYDHNYLLSRIEALLSTPITAESDQATEIQVTLAGQKYRVKSGRQQVLNLLVSTFENAVEKNRELHRANEQLTLAKEKLTQWNAQLESLNGQLAKANDRMSRDLAAAARVQRSLLPDDQLQISGVSIAWKYTPCEELAGDFLNLVPLDDSHLAIFVVDVSGHGAASSLLAVAVGRLLTGQASATSLLVRTDPLTGKPVITPPAAVVSELNRRFPMESQAGLYFTIAYGVLSTKTRAYRYVSAGHPAGVHLPQGAAPTFLEGEGFPVGWLEDVDYDEQRIQLAPGDRLYFYSDGVNEALSPSGELYGGDRLLANLTQYAGQPVAEGVTTLFQATIDWSLPQGPHDDVSIVGIEIE
ncbi:MAG: PP2C family protein-serine/threonine phosphatase [Planctomycetaceae bacterium]